MKLLTVIRARYQMWVAKQKPEDQLRYGFMPGLSKKQVRKQLEQLDTRRRKINAAQERARVKIAADVRFICKKQGMSALAIQDVLIKSNIIPDCRVATRKAQGWK